jgi:micrococcal nuclease
MIRFVLCLITIISLSVNSAAAEFRPLLPTKKPVVAYVVDGDTIAVHIDRAVEKVRLIGIDTPESRKNDRAAQIGRASCRERVCYSV